MIKTSSDLGWKSLAIFNYPRNFDNLCNFLGNEWKLIGLALGNLLQWESLEIFQKCLEIVEKLSKTKSLVCLVNNIINCVSYK